MLSTKDKWCIFEGEWSISTKSICLCLQFHVVGLSTPREDDDILVLCCEPGGGLGEEPREIGSIMQFPNTWTCRPGQVKPSSFLHFSINTSGRRMMEMITFLRIMNICIEIFQTDHLEDIWQLPLERNSRDGTDKTDSDSSNAESK